MAREEAYEFVQRNAMKTWDEGADYKTLVLADKEIRAHLSEAEIARVFSLDTYLRNVDKVFARVFGAVAAPGAMATGSGRTYPVEKATACR